MRETADHEALRQHMLKMVVFRRDIERAKGVLYLGIDDFIMRHGKPMLGRALPPPYAFMEPKQCFANAMRLTLGGLHGYPHTDDLTYCEGYVLTAMPIHHAWCLDREGLVVDPTLRGVNDRTAYFGVAFNGDYVFDRVVDTGWYASLLDAPRDRWPLLTGAHAVEDALQF